MSLIVYVERFLLIPVALFCFFTLVRMSWFETVIRAITRGFQSRNVFAVNNIHGDIVVINIVRVLFSLVLLYRWYWLAAFSLPLDYTMSNEWLVWLYLGLVLTLLVGFLTPLVALLLLLLQLHINISLSTYTLGVDVSAMLLVTFVLYPVGQNLSFDSILSNKYRWVKKFYGWFSYSDAHIQIGFAKALSFLSYCLLCLYSVFMHIDEPLWLGGEAGIHILSSSYLSRFYEFFRMLFSTSEVAVILVKFSMVIMMVWYFLLLPFVLIGGLFRKLAIIWAVLFFLLSTFVLQLSILPLIEFLILFVWFWSGLSVNQLPTVNMLFDDRCNLCDRTVRFLRFIDICSVIRFLPISKNEHEASRIGVSADSLRKDIYCWDEKDSRNRVYSGYDFYLHIAKRMILLWPVMPIIMLGKLLWVGPFLYRYIADYRIKMFGVCTLPVDTENAVEPALFIARRDESNRFKFFLPFSQVVILFGLIFIAILPPMPTRDLIRKEWPDLIRSAHILSWTRINVFNRDDLGMSHQYFTVEALVGTQFHLLPYTGQHGERLEWHVSDRVYFGNSLRWRRKKNQQPILPPTEFDLRKFCEITVWARRYGYPDSTEFRFQFYQVPAPIQNDSGLFHFSAPMRVGTIVVNSGECLK